MTKDNFISKKISVMIVLIFLSILFIPWHFTFALRNPAAVYCKALGYKFIVKETEQGEIGKCKFSETKSCPAWDFLVGKCGQEYSYCAKQGYGVKTIRSLNKCPIPYGECAMCILKDGREVEVTRLMGLTFEEGVCGDGRCVLGENYKICPQDCPSGSADLYCDGLFDGICDPDCTPETDFDCKCGDGLCQEYETQESCCRDCGCQIGMKCIENKCQKEYCGNERCEPAQGENYKTCPQDCPSGSKDGYCDRIKDNICDPDCKSEQDIDCKGKLFYPIIFAIIGIFTAAILYYLFRNYLLKSRK